MGAARAAERAAPKDRTFHYREAVAQVLAVWGDVVPLVSLAWATRDHFMPWPVLWFFYHRMDRPLAIERVQVAQGVGMGMMDHEKPEAKALFQTELDAAFGAIHG